MRSILLIILFSLATGLPVLAGEETPSYPESGLEFGLPTDLGLDDFGLRELDGYDVSWTRRTSADRGWRLGMTVYYSNSSDEYGSSYDHDTYMSRGLVERDTDSANFAVRLQRLFVSEPRRDVSVVAGFGPSFRYSQQNDTRRSWDVYYPDDPLDPAVYPEDTIQKMHTEKNTVAGGVVWDLGFEWRPWDQISLGARYQWSFEYSSSDGTVVNHEDGEVIRSTTDDSSRFVLTGQNSVDLVATFWY